MISILSTILIVLLVVVCLLMLLIILMQRPKQEGLGAAFGGDIMNQMAGSYATSALQKMTTILTVVFYLTCLGLAVVQARQAHLRRTVDKPLADLPKPAPAADATKPADAPAADPAKPAEAPAADAAKPAEPEPAAPAADAPKPAEPAPAAPVAPAPATTPDAPK